MKITTPLYEVIGSHPPSDGHKWTWQRHVFVAAPDAAGALSAATLAYPQLNVHQVLRRAREAELIVPDAAGPAM